ncbi:hypothetical protein NOCA2270007 [metagenome]|uniref:Peptidase C14 caspase domain-containing protein n=1 Tax=metagenome TaxID=256318 RepID=A0A2P2C3P9_9ZZZZ
MGAEVRRALIVASDTYDDPGLRQLRAPAADARALSRVLSDPAVGGFEVTSVVNRPAHEVALAVEDFFADRAADDLLLVHFSCHGVKDESGELYFAMPATRLGRLGATGVSAEFVNRQMARSRSRRVVLLLDCCYAGAFERGLVHRADASVGVESQLGGRGRAVVTASSALEYAFEGDVLTDSPSADASPSIFTSALVSGLETGEADRDHDGLITLDELYDHIYDTVRATTTHQTPGKWVFGVEGDLVIAKSGRPVTGTFPPRPRPRTAPAPASPDARPRHRPRLRRVLVAGLLAGVAVAALTGWLLNRDPGPSGKDEQALLAGVPSSIQDGCGEVTTTSEDVATVSCEGGMLSYTLAPSQGAAVETVGSTSSSDECQTSMDDGDSELTRYQLADRVGTVLCQNIDGEAYRFTWHDDAAPLVVGHYQLEATFDDGLAQWERIVTAE